MGIRIPPRFVGKNSFYLSLLAVTIILLVTGFMLFCLEYGGPSPASAYPVEFHYTFYFFYGIATFSIVMLFHTKNPVGTTMLMFLSFTSLMVLGYSIGDYLSIRTCLYLSLLLAAGYRFTWPYDLCAVCVITIAVTIIHYIPPFLGENMIAPAVTPITVTESITLFFLLSGTDLAIILIKRYRENYLRTLAQISVLNSTITKLTEFNQSLQSYARVAEAQAIKRERYRISREIHDISGYMFTNIIAMMDAIISTGCQSPEKTSEICLAARNQAQEGLQETRKALHLLRNLEGEREHGIREIYKIKHIFEETTGVSVHIEAGNLPNSFGNDIDLILYRVVQEGLTNALRHGHATHVHILFWMIGNSVQVIVQDNGEGAKKIIKGIGLLGMEERIGRVNGTVRAMNAPEGGFQLTVRIPIDSRKLEHAQESVYNDQDIVGR